MFEDSKLTWLHHYTHQHTHSNGQGKSKHKLQAWQHHKICKRAALRGARRTESARAREGEIAAREIHTGRCKKSRHHLLRGGFLSRPGYAIRDHCRTFSSSRGAPKQRHTHTHTQTVRVGSMLQWLRWIEFKKGYKQGVRRDGVSLDQNARIVTCWTFICLASTVEFRLSCPTPPSITYSVRYSFFAI